MIPMPPRRVTCAGLGSVDDPDLSDVVRRLCEADGDLVRRRQASPCAEPLPARDVIHGVVEDLRAVLFPGYFGDVEATTRSLPFHLGSLLDRIRRELQIQVKRSLCFECSEGRLRADCEPASRAATLAFLETLPEIRDRLSADVQAAYEGDPAARSPDETIFCYPGIQAITCHRIAHALHHLDVPLLPRIVSEYAHGQTGIDIHPGAHIDEGFFIDHGTGVVIGETCRIGKGVRLYQGVTLGAKSFPLDEDGNPIKGIPRHPILEDGVTVYAGATILGRVTIGERAVVGGNVWLTRDVPAGAFVTQQQPRKESFAAGEGI
jgi:serine O-acetyltransferase